MSRYTIDHSSGNLNTTSSPNTSVWNNCASADDWSQLLTSSPQDPRLRHRDVRERRVGNVGEWLIQSEEFRRWSGSGGEGDGDNAVLFCFGDQGVGKTFISSLVVDRLCDQAGDRGAAVTCFYFDSAARREQSAASMLGSLVEQVASRGERIPEEISRGIQEIGNTIRGHAPQIDYIVKMLQLITSSQPTFICIDALDECVGVQRVKILESLKLILGKSPGARIFVTGRPHIRAEIESRLAGRVTCVPADPRIDDIISYLRVRLSEDETPDAMDESLEAAILEVIPENIPEMFLLASLNIEAILQESTIYQRRERLSKITDGLGLGDAYGAAIERIKAQGGDKSKLGIAALMWISHAERPLSADELCHALAVELGSTDFNTNNLPSISALVNCCQGLMTVDKEASTVRLIHSTLKEYLSAHPDIFSRPDSEMAEICLTYLNSEQVKAHSAGPSNDILITPFLGYCSLYWGVHAKRELSDDAMALALVLLLEYDGHISAKSLLAQAEHVSLEALDTSFQFSGLHCASFFGIAEVVSALIEMGGYDINLADLFGCTPLSWAAENGHEGLVEILLQRAEVNPNKPNELGRTPLSYAAGEGHGGVVKILLGREDVDPDKPDNNGRAPLWHAVRNGHEDLVKILLGRREVNPEKLDEYGRTPLACAAHAGHQGVVEILLQRAEVNPNKPDEWNCTPLSNAAEEGHAGVVRILLRREEVNPDESDNHGITPLSLAARNGHEDVVEILLGREEVDPDKPDGNGRTPLWLAAGAGHGEVVKILLGRDAVNPDSPNHHGTTPLLVAAERGWEDVVKMLLRREEVNPERLDNDGDTALSCAAYGGHEGIIKALLEQEGVRPDHPNRAGQTPLLIAAQGGYESAVKILLGREEVNPKKADNGGRTALIWAACHNHESVIELLLLHEAAARDALSSLRETTP